MDAGEIETLPSIDLDSGAFEWGGYSKLRTDYFNFRVLDCKFIEKYICKWTDSSSGSEDESSFWKLFVPSELRQEVIYLAHDVPNSEHGGIATTLERVRRYCHWSRLVTDVREYIQNDGLCKTSKTPTTILRPPMGQIVKTERPFQRIYIDLVGPLPWTKTGHIGIFIILNHFTKFTFLKPLRKFSKKNHH